MGEMKGQPQSALKQMNPGLTWRPALARIVRPPSQEMCGVPDLLNDIRRDIDRRLDELGPVRDEFRRLGGTVAPRPTLNQLRHDQGTIA
jgi:hypothetical protein